MPTKLERAQTADAHKWIMARAKEINESYPISVSFIPPADAKGFSCMAGVNSYDATTRAWTINSCATVYVSKFVVTWQDKSAQVCAKHLAAFVEEVARSIWRQASEQADVEYKEHSHADA